MTASTGVETLNAIIAITLDGAGTLAKGADMVRNPKTRALLVELAAERAAMADRLKKEVVSLGGVPEQRGTVVGAAHRIYTEVKLALAPDDRSGLMDEILRSEERVRDKMRSLLDGDKALPRAVRQVVEGHFDGVCRAHLKLDRLGADADIAGRGLAPSAAPARLRRKGGADSDNLNQEGVIMAKQRNEGEGNKTAAKTYNEATTRFARSGKVEQKAEEAAQARKTSRAELDRAERAGKSKAKGEDPQLRREHAKSD